MKPKIKIIISVQLCWVLISCSGKLSPVEYMRWMNDKNNHLIVEQQYKNFIFSAQYKTPEYVTLIDQGTTVVPDLFRKKIQEYKGLEYYTFRIGSFDEKSDVLKNGLNEKDNEASNTRLNYFSSTIEKDIKLTCGKDTFPCSIFLFERTYNMTSFNNFILAFNIKNNENNCDRVLVFDDHNLGAGLIKLTILKNSIDNIPNLSLL